MPDAAVDFIVGLGDVGSGPEVEAAVDFVFQLGIPEPDTAPLPRAAVDFVFQMGLPVEQNVERVVRADFHLGLLVYDNYRGPGSGVTTSGVRDILDELREGDRVKIVSFRTGLYGVNGIADVVSRKVTSDRDDQEIGIQVTRQPDEALVPLMEGGDDIRSRPTRREIRKLGQK